MNIDRILVPQGAEYQAFNRGISQKKQEKPLLLPIPMGYQPLSLYLEQWKQTKDFLNNPPSTILIMGLCGSLSSKYAIGDVVVYQRCAYAAQSSPPLVRDCHSQLTNILHQHLKGKSHLVRGLTSDRLIWSAKEKYHLGEAYQADVVDMEGFAALEQLTELGIAVAMIRVISDDSQHNLPNITSAINPNGSLKPFSLAMGMIKQPLAAVRLIRGSLEGLKVLQQVASTITELNQR